jgi:hypothetical protein
VKELNSNGGYGDTEAMHRGAAQPPLPHNHRPLVEIRFETFLDKWLLLLEADGLRVGVNWSGPRATG